MSDVFVSYKRENLAAVTRLVEAVGGVAPESGRGEIVDRGQTSSSENRSLEVVVEHHHPKRPPAPRS